MARDLGRLASCYFAAQAVLVVTWWGLVLSSPPVRATFFPAAVEDSVLHAFAVADGVVLVLGSLAVAVGLARGRRSARTLAVLVVGASTYATCWCAGVAVATGEGALAVVSMSAMTAASALAAYLAARNPV